MANLIEWVVGTFRQYPELAIFLTLALGYWLGSVKLGTFSLGAVTSVLLAGIVVGQMGITTACAQSWNASVTSAHGSVEPVSVSSPTRRSAAAKSSLPVSASSTWTRKRAELPAAATCGRSSRPLRAAGWTGADSRRSAGPLSAGPTVEELRRQQGIGLEELARPGKTLPAARGVLAEGRAPGKEPA